MASEFSSNSTHDAKVAKNVSSVLLNSIGSLLRISSMDARIETKDDFTKESVSRSSVRLEKAAKIGPIFQFSNTGFLPGFSASIMIQLDQGFIACFMASSANGYKVKLILGVKWFPG